LALLFGLSGCGSRSGLTASSDEAAPPAACPNSPQQPVMLATVGDAASYDRVVDMTVAQGFIYFTVVNGSNSPVGLFRVPVGGGSSQLVVPGQGGCDSFSPFAYGNLASDGQYVFGADQESIGCAGYSARITAYDAGSDQVFQLGNPAAADSEPRVLAPRALASGGVAWVIDPGTYTGPVVLARWTAGSASTVVAPLPAWTYGFVVAGDVGFVSTVESGTRQLHAVSLSDGGVTALETVSSDFELLAGNDEAVYYTSNGSALSRREVTSGAVSALAVPVPQHARWVDHDFLYVDSAGVAPLSSPAVLTRFPAKGGAGKEIYRDDARNGIQAITGDACNVYWVAGRDYDTFRAPAIFARRR